MSQPAIDISDDTVARYQADGVAVLRGVFAGWVEPLRAGIARLMADPSPLERTVVPADGSAPFFQDLCNWQRVPEFTDFVNDPKGAALAAALMRSRTARWFHDHVLVKQPGTSTVTPWHHDQPYYCVEGEQSVSFWIPLDPVPRDVVMECIRGSHRWARGYRPMRFNGMRLYETDDFEEMPDLEAMRPQLDIAVWDMQPGDAIAFHFRTLHTAPGNRAATPRRVFSARWVGDDAVFARRSGTTSPPFNGLVYDDGAPFDAPIFPVIHGRSD